jgi:hypothetical protein
MSTTTARLIDLNQGLTVSSNLYGLFKGYVEDTRDPFGLGRIRARIFQIHGTPEDTPTIYIPWSEPVYPNLLSYYVPQVHDRVWITFEAGHKNRPLWLGTWNAIPVGRGAPDPYFYSSRTGSEIPREAWDQTGLIPEAVSIYRSHKGNQIFVVDHQFEGFTKGILCNQDIGGKFLKLVTYIEDKGSGSNADEFFKPLRKKDYSTGDNITSQGSVELSNHAYSFRNRSTSTGSSWTYEINSRKTKKAELKETGSATEELKACQSSFTGTDYSISSIRGTEAKSELRVNEFTIDLKASRHITIRSPVLKVLESW